MLLGNLIKVQRDRTDLHDLLIRCGQELHERASYQVNDTAWACFCFFFIMYFFLMVAISMIWCNVTLLKQWSYTLLKAGFWNMPILIYIFFSILQTIALKVEEENYARIRLVNLKSKEKNLRDFVTQLQENLTEEQRSFIHITTQQVLAIIYLSLETIFFTVFHHLILFCSYHIFFSVFEKKI